MEGLKGVTPVPPPGDAERTEATARPRRAEPADPLKQGDSTSLTPRAQAEASRSQTDAEKRAADARDAFRGQPVLTEETARLLGGPKAAFNLAEELAASVLAMPTLAAQAQANSGGEGVLDLLR